MPEGGLAARRRISVRVTFWAVGTKSGRARLARFPTKRDYSADAKPRLQDPRSAPRHCWCPVAQRLQCPEEARQEEDPTAGSATSVGRRPSTTSTRSTRRDVSRFIDETRLFNETAFVRVITFARTAPDNGRDDRRRHRPGHARPQARAALRQHAHHVQPLGLPGEALRRLGSGLGVLLPDHASARRRRTTPAPAARAA